MYFLSVCSVTVANDLNIICVIEVMFNKRLLEAPDPLVVVAHRKVVYVWPFKSRETHLVICIGET